MNKLYIFLRNNPSLKSKLLFPSSCVRKDYFEKSTQSNNSGSSSSSDSSSDSDSDTESKPKSIDPKVGKELAVNKLNILLQKIIQEDVVREESKLDLAKPINRRLKNKEDAESRKKENVETQIVEAVKDIAQEMGGNIKQTESELLSKLLSPVEPSATTPTNLSDIVKGMKIDRQTKPAHPSRADHVRSILQKVQLKPLPEERSNQRKFKRPVQQKLKPEIVLERIDLFGSEPLGIFTNKEFKEVPKNETWQTLYERDLKLAVTHPPSNYFQQMILWTEQGKLWRFPIDNEQDIEEEKKVYFTEHVFLEDHLEPWCPPKGPLRHFMELVCVGLSKNPYMTAETKREHIEWYRNYFEEKKKILQEIGAITSQKEPQKTIE